MVRRLLFMGLICLFMISVFPVMSQTNARVIAMQTSLRLRTDPTTSSETLDYLTSGTPLTILEQSTDFTWYRVEVTATGQQGWVASGFVEQVAEDIVDIPADSAQVGFTDAVVEGIPILYGLNQNTINIFRKGQAMGNRPNVFSKVGDSITFTDYFLDNIGAGVYNLDAYWYLEGAISYFSSTIARDQNSFQQDSIAAKAGWNAYLLQDPEYANSALCFEGETPLECEYRHTRPAIALIMLGTNDSSFVDAYAYRLNMEWIVQTSIDNGVIPVISTLPNRLGTTEQIIQYNAILRDIAGRYQIPLWDYGAIMATLPNEGLGPDGVHPTGSPAGWIGMSDFKASNLVYGFPIRNLTALHILHSIWQQVILQA
jgi:hypothetical protein